MLHVWLKNQHSQLWVWQTTGDTSRAQSTHKLISRPPTSPPVDSQQGHWQAVANWQQLRERFAAQLARHSVCLYFPTAHLLQVSSELSAAQLKQLSDSGRQYLFEDLSLTPVEQLLIRQLTYAGSHHLYALAQHDLEQWQRSAALVDITIAAMLPDFLLLPIPEQGAGQQISYYQDDDTRLMRQSLTTAMAVSHLPLLRQRMPHLSDIHLLTPTDSTAPDGTVQSETAWRAASSSESLDMSALSSEVADIMNHGSAAHTAVLLTAIGQLPQPITQPQRHALNFFVQRSAVGVSSHVKVTMLVLLVALLTQMAADGLQWYRYQQAAEHTKAAIGRQYQAWYPDEQLNTRSKLSVQLTPKLLSRGSASSSDTNAVATFTRISPLIQQAGLMARSLQIEGDSIRLQLLAADRASLDGLVSTLTAQGIPAVLGEVSHIGSQDSGSQGSASEVRLGRTKTNSNSAAESKQVLGHLVVMLSSGNDHDGTQSKDEG